MPDSVAKKMSNFLEFAEKYYYFLYMASDTIITWQKSYSVNIPLIDSQHMELINLTNKLYRSCLKDNEYSKEIFMEVLQGALSYVGYHFSVEEKIMERVNYSGINAHKTEHKNFVKMVLATIEELAKDSTVNPMNFVKYLKNWVLNHIAVSDTALGNYLIRLRQFGTLDNISLKIKTVEGRYVIE